MEKQFLPNPKFVIANQKRERMIHCGIVGFAFS